MKANYNWRSLLALPLFLAAAPDLGAALKEPKAVLSLAVEFNGRGARSEARVSWVNSGSAPLLVVPYFDTDAGVHFDNLLLDTGSERFPLIAPRKSVAPRWCILSPGARHSVSFSLTDWLPRLGVTTPAKGSWRLIYRVPVEQPAPTDPVPSCDGSSASGKALVWRGEIRSNTFDPY